MNPLEILKNFQDIQSRMGDIQEKMKDLRAEGAAGGDLVKVTIDGTMEVLDIHIDPIAVDPRDVKMLEELVQAAMVSAVMNMREKLKTEMSSLAGGLPIPPGFPGV